MTNFYRFIYIHHLQILSFFLWLNINYAISHRSGVWIQKLRPYWALSCVLAPVMECDAACEPAMQPACVHWFIPGRWLKLLFYILKKLSSEMQRQRDGSQLQLEILLITRMRMVQTSSFVTLVVSCILYQNCGVPREGGGGSCTYKPSSQSPPPPPPPHKKKQSPAFI